MRIIDIEEINSRTDAVEDSGLYLPLTVTAVTPYIRIP